MGHSTVAITSEYVARVVDPVRQLADAISERVSSALGGEQRPKPAYRLRNASCLAFLVVPFVPSREHGPSILEKAFIYSCDIVSSADDVWSRAEQYEFDVRLVGPVDEDAALIQFVNKVLLDAVGALRDCLRGEL